MSTPCLGAPAYLFFPEDEDPTTPAPDLCLTCPSSLTCLQSGWTETWGAWGGLGRLGAVPVNPSPPDRHGRPVAQGDLVRFAELRHETRVVAVAPAGIYVLSPLIGERFVASSDRCFEVVDEPVRSSRLERTA